MSATLDEQVTVELIDGQPHVFWWQRFPYLVEGLPLVFYRRLAPWWTGNADTRRIDMEFWRVSAARAESGEPPELYDLRNDEGSWSLVYAW